MDASDDRVREVAGKLQTFFRHNCRPGPSTPSLRRRNEGPLNLAALIRLHLLLLASVALTSCKFDWMSGDPSVYGTWRLVKRQGAWTGSIYVPEISGYTAKVIFRENGLAQFYRNDTLVNEIPFALLKQRFPGSRREIFMIHWTHKNFPDSQYVLFPGNDTLHLTGRENEISHYYYVKDDQ